MRKPQYKSIIDRYKQSSKSLLSAGVMIDNKRLSKTNSGQASRYLLAFFVLKNRVASQATDHDSIKHLPPFLGVNHHIFMAMFTKSKPAVYDGVTLKNKPLWRIFRAVTVSTESEPHHPMTFHSVVTTQNLTGGHNHA